MPNVPEIEFIVLSKNAEDVRINPEKYNNYITDIIENSKENGQNLIKSVLNLYQSYPFIMKIIFCNFKLKIITVR